MIVDTSALIAICGDEPERRQFLERILGAEHVSMSSASWLEAAVVVDARRDPVLSRRFDELIRSVEIDIVPVTASQSAIARQAYRDFGRGSGHPARLNFGDCFSYALATEADEPLLFKGDDFVYTDVRSVRH